MDQHQQQPSRNHRPSAASAASLSLSSLHLPNSREELIAYERVWRLQNEVDALENLVGNSDYKQNRIEDYHNDQTVDRLLDYLIVHPTNDLGRRKPQVQPPNDPPAKRSRSPPDFGENAAVGQYGAPPWSPYAPGGCFYDASLQYGEPAPDRFSVRFMDPENSRDLKFDDTKLSDVMTEFGVVRTEDLDYLEEQAIQFKALTMEAKELLGHQDIKWDRNTSAILSKMDEEQMHWQNLF